MLPLSKLDLAVFDVTVITGFPVDVNISDLDMQTALSKTKSFQLVEAIVCQGKLWELIKVERTHCY